MYNIAGRSGWPISEGPVLIIKLNLYFWRIMAGNSFGTLFKLTSFGESHGPAIGGIIDGCPAGMTPLPDFSCAYVFVSVSSASMSHNPSSRWKPRYRTSRVCTCVRGAGAARLSAYFEVFSCIVTSLKIERKLEPEDVHCSG